MSEPSSDTTLASADVMTGADQPHWLRTLLKYAVLLILFAALAYAAYYFLQLQQRQQAQLQQLQEAQQQAVLDGNLRIQKNQQDLDALRMQQQESIKNITAQLEQKQATKDEWLIFEAEHLIKVANQQLIFQHDVGTALKALQAADDRLKASGDPGVVALRKALADDLRALHAIPQADIVGISLALSGLTHDVDKLPLQIPDPTLREQQAPQEKTSTSGAAVAHWSDLPQAIWQDLKSLVVIRNHEEPVKALLAPEQRFFLTENLRLQLEQARLAMLAGEADIYHERLDTAQKWLLRYFDKKAKSTQLTLDTLKKLRAENIAPALPDTSRAYQALQRYQQLKNK